MQHVYTIDKIAQLLNCEYQGDGSTVIHSVAPLNNAQTGQAGFLDNLKYRKFLATTEASLVILKPEYVADCKTNFIATAQPYLTYAKLAKLFIQIPKPNAGIHPNAVIAKDVKIGANVSIAANAVIESGTEIGENTVIGAGCYIGENVRIGCNTRLWPNVTVYYSVKIGDRVNLHSGVVIGADGFGWAPSPQGWEKVPQLGGVSLGNDVDVGANTTIDRGALEDTIIADGVKLDNQIQIGHNVKIGAHSAIAGCTAVAGSTTIGSQCMIAGCVGIAGHLDITDNVVLTAQSGVSKSIKEPGFYSGGVPIVKTQLWRKNAVIFTHLADINKRIIKLEKKLTEEV
ncbi:MAG: UDP-3-O-(3-hydroxymyristoyl)glucosamine N-acyltransferase [Pseudomonadota bacterium]